MTKDLNIGFLVSNPGTVVVMGEESPSNARASPGNLSLSTWLIENCRITGRHLMPAGLGRNRAICRTVRMHPARGHGPEAESLPLAIEGAQVDPQDLRGLVEAGGSGQARVGHDRRKWCRRRGVAWDATP